MALSVRGRSNCGVMCWTSFLVVALVWGTVLSVNRDNFKTCDQSSFCKRHRNIQPGSSPYVVLLDTIKVYPSNIDVQILNRNNNVNLLVQLYALKDNTARLKINEVQPIRNRYEIPIGDALIGQPKLQDLTVLERTEKAVTLTFEKNKVVISADPFRIDFITNGEPVVSINAQGLLKFEHYRLKAQPKEAEPAPPGDDQPDEQMPQEEETEEEEKGEEPAPEEGQKEEDEPGLWEEDFKAFHDSKPYGPSSVGVDISFPGFEHVYGIPEHADSMALKTTKDTDPYRLFNLDVFEYELYNPMALYGSAPVMWAHNDEKTVGVFWHNAAETWIDISSNTADKNFFSKMADLVKGNNDIPQTDTHWFSESGIIDVFVMLGPSPSDAFSQYAQLTGTTNLPPLFAIAYHQCRWNYNDEDDVKNVDSNFDLHDIPYDVIWLDIEHTDGKRYFTWAADKFAHSKEMINNVASKGRKMVTIVDPHLKRDDNFKVYADAKSKDLFVKNKDNGEYDGWCWPGTSSWPDFINSDVRKWWASKFLYNEYDGSTPDLFTWNDMNEPSVFNGPEITFHKDVVHMDGHENRDVHNMYGTYVHQATVEGQLLRSDNKERTFVLSRAFFSGSQRYGAIWTGDNIGEWSHLKVTNPMLLSLNLAGITFSGADVGGFFKNPDAELLTRWYQVTNPMLLSLNLAGITFFQNPELLTRWYQAGAFQPFFRAHAHLDTRRREPYLQSDDNKNIINAAIKQRYSYLPLWYTLFYEGEQNGMPVMRPLWVEYPADKETFTIDDEYLIGSVLLAKPITEAGQTGTQVYFPGRDEVWYDIDTYKATKGGQTLYVEAPLNKIPVYQRSGTIVSRKMRSRRSSALMVHDPFTIIICLNGKGSASGKLYVDDYHTFNYRKGEYNLREFSFEHNEFNSRSGDRFGQFTSKEWVEKVIIVGLQKPPNKVVLRTGGVPANLEFIYNSAIQQLVIRKPGVNIATDFSIKLS